MNYSLTSALPELRPSKARGCRFTYDSFEIPAEALLVLTKRDQSPQQTTKGIMPSETLAHHLIQGNLKQAERCVR